MPLTSRILIGASGVIVLAIVVATGMNAYTSKKAEADKAEAQAVVEGIGNYLKSVSLLADTETLLADMQTSYSPYVTEALLQEWRSDPKQIPGRTTSSPWPDRIEVESVTPQGAGYNVHGTLVLMTSTGVAGNQPVTALVFKENGKWQIAVFQIGERTTQG